MFFLNTEAEDLFREIMNMRATLSILSDRNPTNPKLEENTKIVDKIIKNVNAALQTSHDIKNGNMKQ